MSKNALVVCPPEQKSLSNSISEFNLLYQDYEKFGALAVGHVNFAIKKAWEIGRFLNNIRKDIPYGQWEITFRNNFERESFSLRHAQKFMKLARTSDYDVLVSDPAKRKQAYFLCGLNEDPTPSDNEKPQLQTWLGKMKTLWKKGSENDHVEFLKWTSS